MSAVISCGKGSVAVPKPANNSECPSAKGSDLASCKQVDINFETESKTKDSVVGKATNEAAEESNDTEDEAVAVKS